jgi:DNA-binding transcriptional regulator YiaG
MADSTDTTQDLAVEQELCKALRALQIPPGLSVEEAQRYLPTFVAGMKKFYDLRARQIVSASPSKAEGERQLETAAEQLIIKAIGRRRVVLLQPRDKSGKQLALRQVVQAPADELNEERTGNWDSGVVYFRGHAAIPERPGLAWEPGSESTYVEDEDGHRAAAPTEIQAQFAHRCYWEDLIPSPVRFFIRDRDYDLVREGLTQALFARRVYWTYQLESQLVKTASAPTLIAAKGGRPRANAIKGDIVRELRGDRTQPAFARTLKVSTEILQRAENQSEATDATISKICRAAKRKGRELKPNDLKKNTPQKAAKT